MSGKSLRRLLLLASLALFCLGDDCNNNPPDPTSSSTSNSTTVDVTWAKQSGTEASDRDVTAGIARAQTDFNQVSVGIDQYPNSLVPPDTRTYFGPLCDQFYLNAASEQKCDCTDLVSSYMVEYQTDVNFKPDVEHTLIYVSEAPVFDGNFFVVGTTAFERQTTTEEGSIIFDAEIRAALDQAGGDPNLRSTYVKNYVGWAIPHELGHLIGYLHEKNTYPAEHNPNTDCLMRVINAYDIQAAV